MKKSDTDVWFDDANDALDNILGAGEADQIAKEWRLLGDVAQPVVTVFGAYDAGKSSLLKRLLVEAGEAVPNWLTVSARRETFEIGEASAFGCTFRDTPGIEGGNDEHETIAREALIASDVILLVLPPQLLTGDLDTVLAVISGKLFTSAGIPMADAVKTVIARMDEGSVDPTDDEEGYREFLERKRSEWDKLLSAKQLTQAKTDVFTVAADPYQYVGNEMAPRWDSYSEAYRKWDGVDQLIVALKSLPDQLPTLRLASRQRFYRTRLQVVQEGVQQQLHELGLQGEQLSIRREGIALQREQLGALLEAARAELNATVEETLLTATRNQVSLETINAFLAPRLDKSITLWWDEQNARLKRQISEMESRLAKRTHQGAFNTEQRTPTASQKGAQDNKQHPQYGRQFDALFQKTKSLLQEHHENQLGMNFSKVREQLGKLESAGSFEEYQRQAGRSIKLPTPEAAQKAKIVLTTHAWLSMVPAVIELGGLMMSMVQAKKEAAENKRRREELRDRLREQATLMANGAWKTWSEPAKDFQQWLEKLEHQVEAEEDAIKASIRKLALNLERVSRIMMA
jgi:hypothetical protein